MTKSAWPSTADFFRLTSGVHRQIFSHKGFERARVQGGLSVCLAGVLFPDCVLKVILVERRA